MNLFKAYRENNLAVQLRWINEPAKWHFDCNSQLMFTAPQYSNFFRDPTGENVICSAPFFHTTIDGDFTVFTRVSVTMTEQYDAGCLMIMKDFKNWSKLCLEYIEKVPTIVSMVTKQTSDDCISEKIGLDNTYLRASRSGNCFSFHYSLDAKVWKLVRFFSMKCPSEIKVAVAAQCPTGKKCLVTFDFMEYFQKTIKNLRVIEFNK